MDISQPAGNNSSYVPAVPGRRKEQKTRFASDSRKINLLVDIQAKINEGKGKGYERWAKVFNLKEAAKTLNFMVENGITDYGELSALTEDAGKKFDTLSARIKQLEGRMAETAQFKMHIINYSKTWDIYKSISGRSAGKIIVRHMQTR